MKRRLNLFGAAMGVIAAASMTAAAFAAQDADATFSATVVVTRAIVDTRGAVLRELPPSRYRLAQFADGRLRMTMLPINAAAAAGPLGDAFAGITVENRPADGTLEIRDRQGRPLGVDPAPPGAWAAAPPDAGALVGPPATRAERRAAIERRFGARAGRVRGLDRYIVRDGDTLHEMLVHPESALPAELNVATGKALVEHHTFDYTRMADGTWVRKRMASETAMPGTPSQRLVAVSTLDDVRTAGGAR
jgi:hypothetical protein